MEARFEKIRQKYEEAVNDMRSVDLSALKTEIVSLMKDMSSKDENHKLLDKTEDMLVEVTRMIEEKHCKP